jgi:hypothetical protein
MEQLSPDLRTESLSNYILRVTPQGATIYGAITESLQCLSEPFLSQHPGLCKVENLLEPL